VDEWRKSTDEQSFPGARRLLREEVLLIHYSSIMTHHMIQGLLCGGSCGTAFHHALEVAREMPEGTTVVFIAPDSIRNYMTKHLMDEWMWERELFPAPIPEQNSKWYNTPVSHLKVNQVSHYESL